MAADLFVVPTVTFRLLFVLVLLAHDRRRIIHVAVTEHPTAAWTAQQLLNAFSDHDRDSVSYRRDDHHRRQSSEHRRELVARVTSL
jgi:phenylpyruvate tautomerase PptA (4-oxalocrotonate tautomerase family)